LRAEWRGEPSKSSDLLTFLCKISQGLATRGQDRGSPRRAGW
jgi:hypothetical protein